jgi:hypothetical protein
LTFRNSQNGGDSPLPANYESDFKSALEQFHRRGISNSIDGGSSGSHRQYNSQFREKTQPKIQSTFFNQKANEYNINKNRTIEERK